MDDFAGSLPEVCQGGERMLMSHSEVQGLQLDELHAQALQVLATLSEDQLLVVISYARALLGDAFPQKHHVLEELLEEGL